MHLDTPQIFHLDVIELVFYDLYAGGVGPSPILAEETHDARDGCIVIELEHLHDMCRIGLCAGLQEDI